MQNRRKQWTKVPPDSSSDFLPRPASTASVSGTVMNAPSAPPPSSSSSSSSSSSFSQQFAQPVVLSDASASGNSSSNSSSTSSGTQSTGVPIPGGSPQPSAATKKNAEYIALLQERNRIMKRMQERAEKKDVNQKEKGFNLYWHGANKDDVANAKKVRSVSTGRGGTVMVIRKEKSWKKDGVVAIRTDDGFLERISNRHHADGDSSANSSVIVPDGEAGAGEDGIRAADGLQNTVVSPSNEYEEDFEQIEQVKSDNEGDEDPRNKDKSARRPSLRESLSDDEWSVARTERTFTMMVPGSPARSRVLRRPASSFARSPAHKTDSSQPSSTGLQKDFQLVHQQDREEFQPPKTAEKQSRPWSSLLRSERKRRVPAFLLDRGDHSTPERTKMREEKEDKTEEKVNMWEKDLSPRNMDDRVIVSEDANICPPVLPTSPVIAATALKVERHIHEEPSAVASSAAESCPLVGDQSSQPRDPAESSTTTKLLPSPMTPAITDTAAPAAIPAEAAKSALGTNLKTLHFSEEPKSSAPLTSRLPDNDLRKSVNFINALGSKFKNLNLEQRAQLLAYMEQLSSGGAASAEHVAEENRGTHPTQSGSSRSSQNADEEQVSGIKRSTAPKASVETTKSSSAGTERAETKAELWFAPPKLADADSTDSVPTMQTVTSSNMLGKGHKHPFVAHEEGRLFNPAKAQPVLDRKRSASTLLPGGGSGSSLSSRSSSVSRLSNHPDHSASVVSSAPSIKETVSDAVPPPLPLPLSLPVHDTSTSLIAEDDDILSQFVRRSRQYFSYYSSTDALPGPPVTSSVSADSDQSSVVLHDSVSESARSSIAATASMTCKFTSIPLKPSGSVLRFEILSTYGDPLYCSLNGIDAFDADGLFLDLGKLGSPSMITDAAAFDGMVFSSDVRHLLILNWKERATIEYRFKRRTSIGAIRIWNADWFKSGSPKGVENLRIALDDAVIFEGEVCQCGGPETILFVNDDVALQCMVKNDPVEQREIMEEKLEAEAEVLRMNVFQPAADRPKTASSPSVDTPILQLQSLPEDSASAALSSLSPTSSAVLGSKFASVLSPVRPSTCIRLQEFRMKILSSWGDPSYVGLTRLVFVDPDGSTIPVAESSCTSVPEDINVLYGGEQIDPRVMSNICFRATSPQTCDEHNMWLCPLHYEGDTPEITVRFPSAVLLSEIRIYNYNKNADDASRGVCGARVLLSVPAADVASSLSTLRSSPSFFQVCEMDCKALGAPSGCSGISAHIVVRKAPGLAEFDYSHVLITSREHCLLPYAKSLQSSYNAKCKPGVVYEVRGPCPFYPISFPSGYSVSLLVQGNWGDVFYTGLQKLFLYDAQDNLIPVDPACVRMYMNGVSGKTDTDPRTPDKLFTPICERDRHDHSFLVPWNSRTGQQIPLVLVFMFPVPIQIGRVVFVNYAKTPSRGMKDVEMYVDGRLVWKGVIPKDSGSGPLVERSVCLSSDHAVLRRERAREKVLREKEGDCWDEEQRIWLWDSGKMLLEGPAHHHFSTPLGAERPFTSAQSLG
eukprot:ANDGO_03912.mRNA.1 Protein KIAA0556 homolog